MKFKILTMLLSWALAVSVQAQAPTALQARSLAASCAACHGTNGQAQPGMIVLAGVPQEVTAAKMRDFKAGRLPAATVMHQLAKGYTDDDSQSES